MGIMNLKKDRVVADAGLGRYALARMDEYYSPKVKKYGNSPRAVGWINRDNQLARFMAACDVGHLEGASILDAGCGLGHFYEFLLQQFHSFSYVGLDISPLMIENARKLYPEAHFKHEDVLTYSFSESFDYAVTIGPYNVEVKDNREVMQRMIKKLFALASCGIAISMTSGEGLPSVIHYFDDEAMVNYCMGLTPHVYFRKNRVLGDIIFYLYHSSDIFPPEKTTAGYERPQKL